LKKIINWKAKVVKGLMKLILNLSLLFVILIILLISLVQLPASQHVLINKANTFLSEQLGFTITVKGIYIDWFDEIALVGVTCIDPEGGKMVYLDEAEVDYTILSLFRGKFNIDNIELTNGEVNLVWYKNGTEVNFAKLIWNIQELTTPSSPDPNRKPVPFDIGRFTINNVRFSYHDQRSPYLPDGMFDQNHFTLDSIYGLVSKFKTIRDTVELRARHLQVKLLESHIRLHELSTDFRLTKNTIECSDLYARLGDSFVGDYLKFTFDSLAHLSDFNHKVTIHARLRESSVFVKDLAHFAPPLSSFNDTWKINADVDGTVDRLKISHLNAYFGRNGNLAGNLTFTGLPKIDSTYMKLQFSRIKVFSSDLEQYTGPVVDNFLDKFGRIEGDGRFIGLASRFKALGNFETSLGYLKTDVNFNVNAVNKNASSYKGYLQTKNFQIGDLLGYGSFGEMDMEGTIDGYGLSLKECKLSLDADFSKFVINGYPYQHISTQANLKDHFFDGIISVKDSNFKLEAEGTIDLAMSGEERFDIKGELEHWDLHKTKFSAQPAAFATTFDFDFIGTDLDKVMGDATLMNSDLNLEDKNLQLKFAQLFIVNNDPNRFIRLNSDFVNGQVGGTFKLSTLLNDLPRLYQEYSLFVSNEKKYIEEYYRKRGKIASQKYKLDYNFHFKRINPLLDIFLPGTYMADNARMEGSYSSGYTSILNTYITFDTLVHQGHEIRNGMLDISTSKITDSSDVLASFIISSASQEFKSLIPTERLLIEGVWAKNKIQFSSSIKQKSADNRIAVSGVLSLMEKGKMLELKNSYAMLLGKRWAVKDSNQIYFNAETIDFTNCKLGYNNNTIFDMSGSVSRNRSKDAVLRITGFQLENLNPLLDYKLSGVLNAKIRMRDIYQSLDFTGRVVVDSLAVDKFYIGDVKGKTDWVNENKALNVLLDVTRDNTTIINTIGKIFPGTETKKTDVLLIANLNKANLSILSPILSGVMSELDGVATGKLTIRGAPSDLRVKGDVKIRDGSFKIDYLGTRYFVNDAIYFDDGVIGFHKLKLLDKRGNTGVLQGGIYHDGFKDFLVDISGECKNFNVLNTSEKDNELYYGEAYATGKVGMIGAFDHLKISATLKTEKDTRIYIPIGSSGDVTQSEFIRYKVRNKIHALKDSSKPSAVEVDLNLEITEDAYSEVIFDKQAGDIIKAWGEGNLNMKVDTRGDFLMVGGINIKKGQYNFTLAGLINKAFKIDPKKENTLTWNGDPFAGVVNIHASHLVQTSLKPIVTDTSLHKRPELQRKYDTYVLLNVKGPMLSPEITLGCSTLANIQDPAISLPVKNYMDILQTNDQELNKQVFSLIMMRRFSAPNSFSGGSIGGGATLTELFSNQLSHILSQVDENLEVNVNLQNLNRDALNAMQLRFTYTALDGRLRISREGSFQNVQNSNQANISNIAGEWTVEYLISEDGRLRLKLFNKIQNNSLVSSLNTATNTSAGFSMMHTQSFDSLSELIGGRRRRKQKEKEKKEKSIIININPEEEDNSGSGENNSSEKKP
jgi:hypothetical protein